MTVNIEVIHDRALNLLSQMEKLDLIRFNAPASSVSGWKGEKLSERFAGTLRLSDAAYETFQKTLQEGRDEWVRDIC